MKLPRLWLNICRECSEEFETYESYDNHCECCREKTVPRAKPLNKTDPRSTPHNELMSMKDFEPENKALLKSIWIREI